DVEELVDAEGDRRDGERQAHQRERLKTRVAPTIDTDVRAVGGSGVCVRRRTFLTCGGSHGEAPLSCHAIRSSGGGGGIRLYGRVAARHGTQAVSAGGPVTSGGWEIHGHDRPAGCLVTAH